MAAYEAWKEHKLTSETDLSVAAYNLEMEAQALAWDEGWRTGQHPEDGIETNPYRGPGMRAARVSGNKRISS